MDIQVSGRTVRIDKAPNQCPRCHLRMVAMNVYNSSRGEVAEAEVECVFLCANQECQRLFIAVYRAVPVTNPSPGSIRSFSLTRVMPLERQQPTIPDLVIETSPAFVDTYSQALASEQFNLDQLTGIGLRKALEFLVKDFSVSRHPTHREEIIAKPLATCIRDYLEDPNLRETSKRATWLGNDETHYMRKWDDHDIEDLKILIRLTINWVENVLLTEKYKAEMPEKR